MDPFLASIISIAGCSALAGFIIGLMFSRIRQTKVIVKAQESVRKEHAKEKEELAKDLGSQMKKLRDSISLSIGAYESTLETIEAKLNIEEKEQKLLKLDGPKTSERLPHDEKSAAPKQEAVVVSKDEATQEDSSAIDVEENSEQLAAEKQDLDLVKDDESPESKGPLIH